MGVAKGAGALCNLALVSMLSVVRQPNMVNKLDGVSWVHVMGILVVVTAYVVVNVEQKLGVRMLE